MQQKIRYQTLGVERPRARVALVRPIRSEYEDYKRKVLGEDIETPHRIKYKKLA